MSSIHQQLDAPDAEGWRPEKGDTIVGTVIAIDELTSRFDDRVYPAVTVETEGGDYVALHAFHQVLQSEFARIQPKVAAS